MSRLPPAPWVSTVCGEIFLVILIACTCPLSAIASETYPPVIEEITVTAQKREQSLQEVPISLQVISEPAIRELRAMTVSDLAASAPSLQTGGLIGSSNQQMGLRGIVDYSRNTGIDARLAIYIDGVYQGRSYSSDQPLLGLERVEVLRGPQGTLFGRNTVSGAINLVTKTPVEEFEGHVEAELGHHDYRKAAAHLSGPLGASVFGSLSFSYDESRGYYRNITLDQDTGSHNRSYGRGKLRFVPGEHLEIILAVDAAQSQSTSPLYVNANLPPYTSQQNFTALDEVNFRGTALTLNYKLDSGYSLTSLTSYREADYTTLYDDDITPFDIQTSNYDEGSEQFSQELRWVSPLGERYDWVAGLYYFDSDMSSTRSACFGPDLYQLLIPALAPFASALEGCSAIPNTVGVNSWATYIHGNYRFSDRWELTAGLRYTDDEKKVNWRQSNFPADPTLAAALEAATGLPLSQAPGALFGAIDYQPVIDKRSDSDVSPTISLNAFFGHETMVFGRYARGFQSGGFNADFMTSGLDFFEYQEESVDSWELGVKSTAADGSLRLNATAFWMKFDDFQVFQFLTNSAGGTTLQLTNAGKATSQGVELETAWIPMERLEFTFNVTALDARYDLFENPDPSEPDFTGNRLPYAPDWKTYLSVQYLQPLGGHGNLRFLVDHSWVDRQYSDPSNGEDFLIDSYGMINARVGWVPLSERWEFVLWARNLAGEEYRRINSLNFLGFPRTIWGAPRSYGASFAYFLD